MGGSRFGFSNNTLSDCAGEPDEAAVSAHGGTYAERGAVVGALVDAKNDAYGDSFSKTAQFLRVLYPDGIPVESYADVGLLVRVFDKLVRIATNNDPFGESPWRDIAGYAILGEREHEERNAKKG